MAITSMRGIARRFIPEMLQKGLTSGGGMDLLKLKGMGYRRKDFLADWREYSGRERKRDPLRSIPKKHRPTWDTIEESEYDQAAKFNYTYKVEGYDTFQQKDIESWMTVTSDTILTMEEAEEEAERLIAKYKAEIQVKKVVIDAVTTWGD